MDGKYEFSMSLENSESKTDPSVKIFNQLVQPTIKQSRSVIKIKLAIRIIRLILQQVKSQVKLNQNTFCTSAWSQW